MPTAQVGLFTPAHDLHDFSSTCYLFREIVDTHTCSEMDLLWSTAMCTSNWVRSPGWLALLTWLQHENCNDAAILLCSEPHPLIVSHYSDCKYTPHILYVYACKNSQTLLFTHWATPTNWLQHIKHMQSGQTTTDCPVTLLQYNWYKNSRKKWHACCHRTGMYSL